MRGFMTAAFASPWTAMRIGLRAIGTASAAVDCPPPGVSTTSSGVDTGVASGAITELPSLDFSSGYVQRSIAKLPKQGSKRPWRLYQNYALDIVTLRYGRIDDGVMRYS